MLLFLIVVLCQPYLHLVKPPQRSFALELMRLWEVSLFPSALERSCAPSCEVAYLADVLFHVARHAPPSALLRLLRSFG